MDRKILFIFIVEALVCQVFTANLNLHPAVKQYLLASLGSLPQQLNTRQPSQAVTLSKQIPPNFQSIAALASLLSSNHAPLPPKPQPVSTNSLLAALTDTQPNSANGAVDATLLNNLAMALQLLIVSNLLNSSPQESNSEALTASGYTESVQPLSVSYSSQQQQQPIPATTTQTPTQNQFYYEQPITSPNYTPQSQSVSMPNANFVGSSTFAESPFMGTVPPISGASSSRGGFTLMSPYEALSPSSPFSDPILSSPYGSIMTSKKDFQSPYNSIMGENKDLFSLSDFY